MMKLFLLLTLFLIVFNCSCCEVIAGNPQHSPPLPALKPENQTAYEQTLPIDEQRWIHDASAHIRGKLNRNSAFRDLRCSFQIYKNGRITQPITFSVDLPDATREKMIKVVTGFSPLPRFPSGGSLPSRIIVGFDHDTEINSLRLTR